MTNLRLNNPNYRLVLLSTIQLILTKQFIDGVRTKCMQAIVIKDKKINMGKLGVKE